MKVLQYWNVSTAVLRPKYCGLEAEVLRYGGLIAFTVLLIRRLISVGWPPYVVKIRAYRAVGKGKIKWNFERITE